MTLAVGGALILIAALLSTCSGGHTIDNPTPIQILILLCGIAAAFCAFARAAPKTRTVLTIIAFIGTILTTIAARGHWIIAGLPVLDILAIGGLLIGGGLIFSASVGQGQGKPDLLAEMSPKPETAIVSSSDQETRQIYPVPEGFTSGHRRLRPDTRVFHPSEGEGVIVGVGPDRHFMRVKFDKNDNKKVMEIFGLYIKV